MACCGVIGLISAGLDARGEFVSRGEKWVTGKLELRLPFFSGGSYRMELHARVRRSKWRTLPSAPQVQKLFKLPPQNRTSKTALSCAINRCLGVKVRMSHTVQVVSTLDVMIKFGDVTFQSKDVRGAECSGDAEVESTARGVNC